MSLSPTPTRFLCGIFDEKPEITCGATRKSFDFYDRANAQRNWDDYVDAIGNSGSPNCLRSFAERLRGFNWVDDLGTLPSASSDASIPDGSDGPR